MLNSCLFSHLNKVSIFSKPIGEIWNHRFGIYLLGEICWALEVGSLCKLVWLIEEFEFFVKALSFSNWLLRPCSMSYISLDPIGEIRSRFMHSYLPFLANSSFHTILFWIEGTLPSQVSCVWREWPLIFIRFIKDIALTNNIIFLFGLLRPSRLSLLWRFFSEKRSVKISFLIFWTSVYV